MTDLLGTRATGPAAAARRGDDQGRRPRPRRQQVAARVLVAQRRVLQLHEQRARLLARARDGRREHVRRRHDGLRPSGRLVQGRRRAAAPSTPPSAATAQSYRSSDFRRAPDGRDRVDGGRLRPGLQRLRRHRARELRAGQGHRAAEHQRADRLRPAAGRPPHPDDPRRARAPARPGDRLVGRHRADPGLHQQRGRALRPRRGQQLRDQQVGLPVLRAGPMEGIGVSGKPYPAETPPGNAPTIAADLATFDAWMGYFQLSRFKFVDRRGSTPPPPRPRRASRRS